MDLYLIKTALKLALKYATPTDYERVYPTIRAALAELEQATAVEPAQKCHKCGHNWHHDDCVNVAPKEPAQAVPVAEVVWYDPRLTHPGSKRAPHKIIYASLTFFDEAPVGTKLYTAPPSLDAETRAMVLELLTVLDYAMFEFADTEQKVRELKNKIRERIRS